MIELLPVGNMKAYSHSEATLKKSLFPVQWVARMMASQEVEKSFFY